MRTAFFLLLRLIWLAALAIEQVAVSVNGHAWSVCSGHAPGAQPSAFLIASMSRQANRLAIGVRSR